MMMHGVVLFGGCSYTHISGSSSPSFLLHTSVVHDAQQKNIYFLYYFCEKEPRNMKSEKYIKPRN